ncbi:MAG: ABC transporter substrate-binding protein [Candidatus Rokubacteria bacterium]|nr:ABC transporter substrate-binding protein [Candidatus Rokubacteria bacterium]
MTDDRTPKPEPSPTDLSRRRFLQGAAGAAALAAGLDGALARPGAAADTGPLATAGLIPMATPAGVTPKRGGKITGARSGDFNHFDPFYTGAVQWPMHHNLYSALFYYDKDLKLLPGLAERYELSDDKLALKLHLRRGVKFHTGREFVADDVVYNIERAMDKSVGHSAFAQTITMKGGRALDKYTAVIEYKQPTAYLFDTLCFIGMVAKEAVPDIKRRAVGTGPFKLDRWIPGDHARFVRNESYWEPGLPYVDEVIVRSFRDIPSMLVNLEAGQLDIMEPLPSNELERLSKSKDIATVRGNPGFFYNLYLSTKRKPFDNRKVRQAINLAVDRKTIVDKVLYGFSETAQTPFPKSSWAYDSQMDTYWPFDLDRARKLLAEAGLDKGFEVSVVTTPVFPEFTDMALIMQADLAKIGVKMKVEEIATTQYYQRLFGGDFEMMLSFSGRAHKDPGSVWLIQPAYAPGGNMLGWKSGAYEDLLKQGASSFDREKRKAIYRKVQEILLEESFELILARRYTYYGIRKDRLHDFRYGIDGDWYMHRAWIG